MESKDFGSTKYMLRSVANTSVIWKKYSQLLMRNKEERQDINIRNTPKPITILFF